MTRRLIPLASLLLISCGGGSDTPEPALKANTTASEPVSVTPPPVVTPPPTPAPAPAPTPPPPPPAYTPEPPIPSQGWISPSAVCVSYPPDPMLCGGLYPYIPPPITADTSQMHEFSLEHTVTTWNYAGVCNGIPCGVTLDLFGNLLAEDQNGLTYTQAERMFLVPTLQNGSYTFTVEALVIMGPGLMIYSQQPSPGVSCYLTYLNVNGQLSPVHNYIGNVTVNLTSANNGGAGYVQPSC